jgi:hypothetical protein
LALLNNFYDNFRTGVAYKQLNFNEKNFIFKKKNNKKIISKMDFKADKRYFCKAGKA